VPLSRNLVQHGVRLVAQLSHLVPRPVASGEEGVFAAATGIARSTRASISRSQPRRFLVQILYGSILRALFDLALQHAVHGRPGRVTNPPQVDNC
jgi:hypothetical protein